MPTEVTIYGYTINVEASVLITAAGVTLWAYAAYLLRAWQDTIKPSVGSWLIWGVTTGVEAITYRSVSEDWLQSVVFYMSAVCCLFLALIIWVVARAEKRAGLSWSDGFCIIATIAALGVWYYYQNVVWAHLIMVAAVPVSFIPSWLHAVKKPHEEHAVPWLLWTIGDFLTGVLILMRFQGHDIETLYIATEFACHALMLLVVVIGQLIVGFTSYLRSRRLRRIEA